MHKRSRIAIVIGIIGLSLSLSACVLKSSGGSTRPALQADPNGPPPPADPNGPPPPGSAVR